MVQEDTNTMNKIVPDGDNDSFGTAVELKVSAAKDEESAVYQPYGGATTFGEIEANMEAMEYSYKVEEVTNQLRGIIHNITANPELEADQKAKAIEDAAGEYRSRMSEISTKELAALKGEKGNIFKRVIEDIKSLLRMPDEETQPDTDDLKDNIPEPGGFKVYKDKDTGALRWVSLSSNAFEDREKELFTTEALKEAVEYADKTGERGPLLVFHVPSAEIGQCDYQAVVGRFLLESGTFDDTPLGQKAAEFYVNSGEEQQVSIGYTYRDGDEKDGMYEWLRFRERSVCPNGTAANPWTKFETVGGKVMEERKAAELEKIFGKDVAAELISTAEEKTKELEERVRFKEMKEDYEDDDEEKKKKDENKEETTSISGEQVVQLATLITEMAASVDTITEAVSGIKSKLESLDQDVKQLKRTDDEKVADLAKPRLDMTKVARPSEDDKNILENGKELVDVKEEPDGRINNPAQQLANDLLQGRVPANV